MEAIALRPRKATEIVDASIEVYRRHPIHFLLLAALIQVPWLIVQIIYLAPREGDPDAIVTTLVIAAGKLVTTFLMAGFVVHMASEIYLGRETDAFASIRAVAPRIPSIFVASLMQSVAIGMGLVLFLFPAVWVSAVLFAVIPVVVLEAKGPFAAFDRSQRLSDGHKMHILSVLGLVVLIRFMVAIGGGFIALAIPMPELRYVAASAVELLVYPLIGISITLLYYDVRIRKEGFDIEMMADAR